MCVQVEDKLSYICMVGEISSYSVFVILFFVFHLNKMQLMQHYQWGYHCCVFGGKKSLQGESLLCELQHIATNIWNVFLYLYYCNMIFIHHLTIETRLLYSLHSNISAHVWCFQPVFNIYIYIFYIYVVQKSDLSCSR